MTVISEGSNVLKRRKWTDEAIVQVAREWYETYGSLAANDWNPASSINLGHHERAQRFYDFGRAPFLNTVRYHFKKWSTMMERAGLPMSPIGCAARGIHSNSAIRLSSWRPSVPDGGWTADACVAKAIEWNTRFGEWPHAIEWSGESRLLPGPMRDQRLARYNAVLPPAYKTVSRLFGSFDAMLEAAKASQ
jgi:hypothetical protein